MQRVTIIKIRKDPTENINQELQWIGNTLGLFNLRDKDSSCFRVFITIVKKAHSAEPISSDDIAERLNLSRGTVVHHLTRLMDTGIIIREQGGYLLRERQLVNVVRSLKQEMESIFSELQDVAKDIDEKLG